MNSIAAPIEFVSTLNQWIKNPALDTKAFCAFLRANEEHFNTIPKETAGEVAQLVQKASLEVEKGSKQDQTLQKIKHLMNPVKESKMHAFLRSRFGREEIKLAIDSLRYDRFTGETKLNDFLMLTLGKLPEVNEGLIKKDPLLAMFILILNDNPAEDGLRDAAATAYIEQCPEDKRFEKNYVYLKTPHVLLTHLLICAEQWSCANPENTAFYDEQIAGLFHGTLAFDKGDRLSFEELALIQKFEGENPRFPISKKLECKGEHYEVTDWCSTPPMCSTNTRIDALFIASRRELQETVLTDFVNRLKETSAIVQKVYSLPLDASAVVAVIGPYGAGKSCYVQQKFAGGNPVTVYSLDRLNTLLMTSSSRSQDHHFEAMMMTRALLDKLAGIPVLLTETAAIDEFRFNRLVNRDFGSRSRIIIEEIAPEDSATAVRRFATRENTTDIGAAATSATDAQRFRAGRIESAQKNTKIDYRLYCSKADGVFLEIAKVQDGVLVVSEGNQETFDQLVSKP